MLMVAEPNSVVGVGLFGDNDPRTNQWPAEPKIWPFKGNDPQESERYEIAVRFLSPIIYPILRSHCFRGTNQHAFK